jgi:hypothetical protein
LLVLGKMDGFGRMMKTLQKVRDISVEKFNINSAAVIANYVRGWKNDNPDVRAFVISYKFIDRLNNEGGFDLWQTW